MIEQYLGISTDYVVIGLATLTLILIIIMVVNQVKINKLRKRYEVFMKGKTAKSLEDTLIYRLEQVDDLIKNNASNERNINAIQKRMEFAFQKYAVVKYDALEEMGGKLSYALCMLNEKNDGYIINTVHSREGCYSYVKEIIDGNSVIGLAEEEAQALEEALKNEK